ncbi:uncharacterized protein LOC116347469 [Contarinia nasturtii]|uniref:uncharacterized protein LOC116347469 n=1 Tax=Contarinia nasturtii TaxID=265458 RepID=UPI0012D396D6|nr:uncharacterized protein LOC116347469 [Contarinia nasturtii]
MGSSFSKSAVFDAWDYGKYCAIFSMIGSILGPWGAAVGGLIGLIIVIGLEMMETDGTSSSVTMNPICAKISPNCNDFIENFYKSDDIQTRWQNYSMNQSMCGPTPKYTSNFNDNFYKKNDQSYADQCYPDQCSANECSPDYSDPCYTNHHSAYQEDPEQDNNHLKRYLESLNCPAPKPKPQYYSDPCYTNDQCYTNQYSWSPEYKDPSCYRNC